MAVLKNDSWQVFFHYGQLDASHAQAEALHYEAYYQDTDVTHDPGTVGYGSPLHKDYYRTGLAHNGPLIDGLGQAKWNRGELLTFAPERGTIAARQSEYQPQASATRTLQIDGDRLIDTVQVETKDAGMPPARPGLVLHLQGTAKLPGAMKEDDKFATAERPPGFKYWTDVRSAFFTDRVVLEVDFANRPMRLTFEVPGSFRLSVGRAPDVPPGKNTVLYLESTGTRVTFKTVFEPLVRR